MNEDCYIPFGYFAPGRALSFAISLFHRHRHKHRPGLFLKLISSALMRWAASADRYFDIEVAGIRLRSNFSDNYSEGKFIFSPWRYDVWELDYIRQNLPQDGVFIDIGANVGLYTIAAASVMSGRGTIVAFEPNPEVMHRLKFNVASSMYMKSDPPDIDLVQMGVADQESSFEFMIHPVNFGGSSIDLSKFKKIEELGGRKIMVPCRRLLEFCVDRNIQRIDILKIDIEGAEDVALAPFLSEAPPALLPKALIIEKFDRKWRIDIPGMLASLGYRRVYDGPMNSVLCRI
jgi:FkbM family methyltransferase